jgi:hypothetical protein
MTASFPAFTQIDTTRLVGVKAYKLGYLIRDAKLLRLCDSMASQQAKALEDKAKLVAGLDKEISSLKRENGKLQKTDSVNIARQENLIKTQELQTAKLKSKLKKQRRIMAAGTVVITVLVKLLL